jgi:hypothetical protein
MGVEATCTKGTHRPTRVQASTTWRMPRGSRGVRLRAGTSCDTNRVVSSWTNWATAASELVGSVKGLTHTLVARGFEKRRPVGRIPSSVLCRGRQSADAGHGTEGCAAAAHIPRHARVCARNGTFGFHRHKRHSRSRRPPGPDATGHRSCATNCSAPLRSSRRRRSSLSWRWRGSGGVRLMENSKAARAMARLARTS